MHVPDGYLNHATQLGTALLATGALSVALARAPREFTVERGPAYIGAVAAAVFAGQMMNFPVGSGTSGHLMGGVLAAVLIGPWTAMVSVAAVLIIQAVVFADGGLSAIGANFVLMGPVAIATGWLLFRGLARILPSRTWALGAASGFAAFLSVPAAALVFSALHAIGGVTRVEALQVAQAMLSWHVFIGLGEALITVAVVVSMRVWHPELVRGWPSAKARSDVLV